LEKNAQALLVKFKIEQHRLVNWGKLVRLNYTEEELQLNSMSRGMIMDILHQQQKLLASFGRLDKRYSRMVPPLLQEQKETFVIDSDRLLENGSSTSEESKQSVQFPPAEELVKKALEWLAKSRDVPKRIRWASWDHEKMESLIVKLSDFNDKMYDALDRAQMDTMLDMQTRFNYQIVLLNRQMENMVQIWQSDRITHQPRGMITDLEESDYALSDSIMRFGSRSLSQPLGALAQQKFVHLAIEDSVDFTEEYSNSIDLPHLASRIRETELSLADIHTTDGEPFPEEFDEGARTPAIYNGTSVWVEWKPNDSTSCIPDNNRVDPKIRSRVQKLAALLASNNRKVRFRAPHCLGYFVDESDEHESRFGLVFEKPASVARDTMPITLRDIISDSVNGKADVPSLTDRITLMKLLAETLERLHAVDWLHKGLRSANILFFPSTTPPKDASVSVVKIGDKYINFADPYISGFDYSRPATSDDMTERPIANPESDIYRHPVVQSTGNRAPSFSPNNPASSSSSRESFKKSYDIYSLGLLFLEISHWSLLHNILAIDLHRARPKHTWQVRNRVLQERQHLGFVKSYLGNTVEGVVRACLEGPGAFGLDEGCDERRGVVAAALQDGFGERVVRRLGGLRV
jgi:hypothetical protein